LCFAELFVYHRLIGESELTVAARCKNLDRTGLPARAMAQSGVTGPMRLAPRRDAGARLRGGRAIGFACHVLGSPIGTVARSGGMPIGPAPSLRPVVAVSSA
jgi:hypothetical protein